MEDLENSWKRFNAKDPNHPNLFSPKEYLKLLFTDDHYVKGTNPKVNNWDDLDIKGIFLIPGASPDRRVVYQCLLNVSGKSNGNKSIKANLRYWLYYVGLLNDDKLREEEPILEIDGNDLVSMWLEPLAIDVIKNAKPMVFKAKDLYKDDIIANRLTYQ